jgi:hypothetical protein
MKFADFAEPNRKSGKTSGAGPKDKMSGFGGNDKAMTSSSRAILHTSSGKPWAIFGRLLKLFSKATERA